MEACELCSDVARLYCESDTASLCFECDAKVHGANFLVARHQRILLCQNCHRPTPWRASGPHLGPTASICQRCFHRPPAGDEEGESRRNQEERGEEEEEEEEEDDGSDDEEDGEEEEEEEQVVPWAMEKETASGPVASSSSSEHESAATRNGVLKRTRENAGDLNSSSSSSAFSLDHLFDQHRQADRNRSDTIDSEATSDSLRPLKSCKGGKTQFRSALRQSGPVVDIVFSDSQPPPI